MVHGNLIKHTNLIYYPKYQYISSIENKNRTSSEIFRECIPMSESHTLVE